ADRVAPKALLAVHLAEGVMQENIGRTGRVGTRVISDDGIEAQPGFHELTLEPAVEVVGGRFRQEIEQRPQIFRGEPTKTIAKAPSFEHFPKARKCCCLPQVWRCLQHERAKQIGSRVELTGEGRILLGIATAEFRNVAFRAAFSGKQVPAIQGWKEVLCPTLDNSKSVLQEAKIGDDLWVQQAHGVGGDGISETRMKLFRDRRATDEWSPFEDLDFQPCHAEVGCAGQPIVTCADDDDVVCLHRGTLAKGASARSGVGHGRTLLHETSIFRANEAVRINCKHRALEALSIERWPADQSSNGSASGDIS